MCDLTLLWYHKKSYVNSTMVSIWPQCKKTWPHIICIFQEFHDCHHLAPLPNLNHLHLFHCRDLTLHWTRGRFHPSSNYLHYHPHVHYRRHLTHLNMTERRCTTIPVVLPLCYTPHVTEPHKRKKITWKVIWGPFVPKRK